MKTQSIMIVGVGGQGTLLASKVLGAAMIAQGYDVKVSEVHGMSQRGGSVVTYVRYGEKVHSPIVDIGQADYLLAFEPLEAARYLPHLSCEGTVVTNTHQTMPMPVITGAMKYPGKHRRKALGAAKVIAVDALKIAQQAGSPKAVNTVLLGVLSSLMDIPEQVWQDALTQHVPPKFLELNRVAFHLGKTYKEDKQ